jgi:hypothetical protein
LSSRIPCPYLVAQADESGRVREEQISVNRHAVDEVIDAQPGQQLSGTLDLEAPFRDGHDDGGRRPVAPVDIGVDDQSLRTDPLDLGDLRFGSTASSHERREDLPRARCSFTLLPVTTRRLMRLLPCLSPVVACG